MARIKSLKASEPSTSDVHADGPGDGKKPKKELTTAFLTHLHGQLKAAKADVSLDDFKGMVAKSRSHAGGKMKAANRAQTAGEQSYGQIMEMVNAELREEFGDPFSSIHCWYAQEIYDDRVIVRDSNEGTYYEIPYTMADGECEFGEPVEVEQTYSPKAAGEGNNVLDLAAKTHGFRLFNEMSCAEPPARMPLMPKPSTHKHKEYGDIVITKARNERFAQNINDHVYQEKIPVDLEHQLKLSGAAGYITSAEVNADGSVDGLVEWTDLGREAIENDRYAYVSPEWFDSWTHPMSEETFKDVVIGAALTTRPFFKEESLRPLIASEAGLQFGEIPKVNDKEIILQFTALAPVPKGESMATKAQIEAARALVKAADAKTAGEATEDQITAARALIASEDAKTANEPTAPTAQQFTELQGEVKQFKERAEKAEARTAAIEKDNRAMKFGETVKDWPGERSDNVAMLEHLFSTSEQGEDGEVFKAHIKTMNATAAQLKASSMFTELGSSGVPATGSAEAEADALAKKMSEDSAGKMSVAQAYREVISKTPGLYERIQKEAN